MKILFILFLTVSLTANAWLWWREPTALADTVMAEKKVAKTQRDPAVEQARAAARLFAALETGDPAQWRDGLRAAGADEVTVRALVEGRLRRSHAEKGSAWQMEQLRNAWWRNRPTTGAPSIRDGVLAPLRELLGPDPFDLADAELPYLFLAPEKRRLLALIDLDYTELGSRTRQARTNAALKAETDEQQMLNRERQRDTLAALTAEERAEYELRFGGTAATTVRRFATMEVTEQEFRVIKPMLDTLQEKAKTLPRNAAWPAAYAELQQQSLDALVTSVGFERAIDYLWAVESGPYRNIVRALREAGRPAHDAAQLLQLASETGDRAAAIHRDPARNGEQKRAALVSLQRSVEPKFAALAPPDVRPALPQEAVAWFADLGEGRYRRYQPLLTGEGWSVPSVREVTMPPPHTDGPIPIARRR